MAHLLIAGLGNPGIEYQDTRHNIGFSIIDSIAEQLNFPVYSNKFSSLISSKMIGQNKITLVKPQTYMNLSGNAISKAINFYKLELENLIVIHDDLDLQFAKIKMKIGGGSGGHNGIKSLDQHLGQEYYRLRIGIGKPLFQQNVSNFVLNKFTNEEEIIIAKLINNVISKLELIIARNLPKFMNEITLEQKKYGI